MNDAAHPDAPSPRRHRLPEVPFWVVGVLTVSGWLLRWQSGPLYALSFALIGAALLLWAAPEINKSLASGRLSWPSRVLAWWRSIPSTIRTITVSAAAFFVALGVFLWAIGVRIDVREVILANSWILVVLIGAALLGISKLMDVADRRAAARRDD